MPVLLFKYIGRMQVVLLNMQVGPEVLHGKVSKDEDACEVKIRPFQMLGSGFRLKRTVVCDIAS